MGRRVKITSPRGSSRCPIRLLLGEALGSCKVNTHDGAGGAARMARDLHEGLLREGDCSILAVGHRRSAYDCVRLINNDSLRNPWSRLWLSAEAALERATPLFRGKGRLALFCPTGAPGPRSRGSARRRLLRLPGHVASRRLGWINGLDASAQPSRQLLRFASRARTDNALPTVLPHYTTHGYWPGTVPILLVVKDGQTGCGSCPDLTDSAGCPPGLDRRNWRSKRDIFAASSLYVATPSRWRGQGGALHARVGDY